MFTTRSLFRSAGGVALALAASQVAAQTVLLSDNFSRTPDNTPLGTAPTRDTSPAAQADANTNWVSSWGANNNALGGTLTQTYTTYVGNDGAGVPRNFKVDGTNGISGNWLNNASPAHVLKKTGGTDTTTEPIGITGFAWAQINHNFAANPAVQEAGRLRVNFDLYRSASGNISWFLGQNDPTGVANGNAGSPSVIGSNDLGLYFRGVQANTYGLRDNGALPSPVNGIANFDAIAYAAGTTLFPQPVAIQIDILGTDFSSGATSTLELTVGGVLQDLNGTDVAGNGYAFTWDGGGAAYMGFASNSTPVEGTVAAPVYRAQGIDNLRISTLLAPFTWAVNASGNWDDAGNWSDATVPNGTAVTATLGTLATAPRTVTLASAVTLDKLVVKSGAGSYVIDSPAASRLTVGTIDVRSGRLDLDDSGNTDSVTVTSNLLVASGAVLNLDGGSLVVNYDATSPLAAIVADIVANKIRGEGAAVAAVEASALGVTSFRGVAVDTSTVLMIRTLKGDTDLNQTVDFDDLLKLAQNYGGSGKDWTQGDSDYSGTVDFDDLLALAQTYGGSLSLADQTRLTEMAGTAFAQEWLAARSLVPEPASVMLLGFAGVVSGRRRRV